MSPPPSSATAPPPRHISARDVRDLALAVIEGAVAAEALAKELKRSPDRSRHFQEIAERLRGVVARTSIRSALADESNGGNVVVSGGPPTTHVSMPAVQVPTMSAAPAPPGPPPFAKAIVAPTPTPPAAQRAVVEEPRTSGERIVPALTTDELIALVGKALHGDEIATRLARLEHAVSAGAQQSAESTKNALREATEHATTTANVGERIAVGTPAEALALAARLTERLQAGIAVTVRIEPVSSGIRRG